MILINIIAFIFMLGLVILIHELGHFIMAKRAGILCHEFALGMGPILYSKKKGETLYSIRAIPIGGFVMMAGEEVNEDMVKVGQSVRVLFEDNVSSDVAHDNGAKITHIILNGEDPRYPEAHKIEVESVDLKGKNKQPLRLNDYEVKRDGYYIMQNKQLQIAPYERSFESKTLLERFLAIFAGPFMNFVLAFFLFILIAFLVGLPQVDSNEIGYVHTPDEAVETARSMPATGVFEPGDRIVMIEGQTVETWADIARIMQSEAGNQSLTFTYVRDGITDTVDLAPVLSFYNVGFSSDFNNPTDLLIGSVGRGSPADNAGLREGDIIISIDNIPMATWEDVVAAMRNNHDGADMNIRVERDGANLSYYVYPFSTSFLEGQGVNQIQPQIGISPTYEREFFGSFTYGAQSVLGTTGIIFSTLRALFADSRVGVGDLAGPVGIFVITSQVVSAGFIAFLSWMAILSVNLGIINLLPVPALDGGRLVFLGYEAIVRKPVNKKVENMLHFIMFILLIALIIFITFNDVIRQLNIG